MLKTNCRHGVPRGLRCELCNHFTCSLRAPPKGLDFPELLLPPYLTPRSIRPPNYFKSMPPEGTLPTATLHNMGVLCRNYSVRIEAANRLAESDARAQMVSPKRQQHRKPLDRFKILSPLAKLRIISPERSPHGEQEIPGGKIEYKTKLVSEVFFERPSVDMIDKDWESSDEDQEKDQLDNIEEYNQTHPRSKTEYPQLQAEKARRQGAQLRKIWEEDRLEKQRSLEEKQKQKQKDEARKLELELAAQEHERKQKSLLARRRAGEAKAVEAATKPQYKKFEQRRVSFVRRALNGRASRGVIQPRLSMHGRTPRTGRPTTTPLVRPETRLNSRTQAFNHQISTRPQSVQIRAQTQSEGIAAARARKLAESTGLVQKRKAERIAADLRRKDEIERRLQEARKKVEAEKRRSAEARQRQHESFVALHQRNKAGQKQSISSKVAQKYLASGSTPRKLFDWQTRRNLKKESSNHLFMLTNVGHSRNFSLLPQRMQVNDDFGSLEADIYLPCVPDITIDDIRIWKMNSADIDVDVGGFRNLEAHLAMASRIDTMIIPPWADRARRAASNLPEHLYYGWRICHNYGYFDWKVPKRTTRCFLQARRFGELDREWDETIARSEVKTQATLEKMGKQENIPMIRVASGY